MVGLGEGDCRQLVEQLLRHIQEAVEREDLGPKGKRAKVRGWGGGGG